MVQKSGAEAEKGAPRSEWYCKTTAELRSVSARSLDRIFATKLNTMHVLAKSVACGWRLALLTSISPQIGRKPRPAMLIATLMILPTVLERFSDAAKVVLLDDAAQPKLWEL